MPTDPRPEVEALREAAKRVLAVAHATDDATLLALVDLEHAVYAPDDDPLDRPAPPPEGLVERLLALLGPSHPHDEGRVCGTCEAYNLLAVRPVAAEGTEE